MPNPIQSFPAIVKETPSQSNLKKLMPILRNHTTLDNRTAIEERTINSGETIKQVFWQTSINEQRPKLKIRINVIVTEGLVDTGMDVTIISLESWHPNWPFFRS